MKPYYDAAGITLYHGDCREVLPTLAKPDLVLTDPPYGIGAHTMTLGNGARMLYRGERDWDAETPDLSPVLALGVPTVIWGGNYFALPLSRCWFVWDKGTGENDYADCELAWTNRDGVVKKHFRSWVGSNARELDEGQRWHPTQKPVSLMTWCIGFYPNARTILDPYAGSGTTLVAAKQAGRNAIGVEIEERYCEMAVKRLAQETLGLSA